MGLSAWPSPFQTHRSESGLISGLFQALQSLLLACTLSTRADRRRGLIYCTHVFDSGTANTSHPILTHHLPKVNKHKHRKDNKRTVHQSTSQLSELPVQAFKSPLPLDKTAKYGPYPLSNFVLADLTITIPPVTVTEMLGKVCIAGHTVSRTSTRLSTQCATRTSG